MRRALAGVGIVAAAVAGCGGPQVETGREGRVIGALELGDGARGNAWVFLYPPGEGPPLTQAYPDQATAVSDLRIKSGDTRFTFALVEPNPYRLWAFLDTNFDFQTEIDVLGGPGAGDRISEGVELNLQPGQTREADLTLEQYVLREPPAFEVGDREPGTTVEIKDRPNALVTLELRAADLGLLRADRTGFTVGLGDSDGDGAPDDGDGDGIPDLFPQVYLRFVRKPGQVVPLDPKGQPAEVILPLLFDPGPYLAALAGDPEAEVVVDRLVCALLPQAVAVTWEGGRGRVTTPMDAIPVGAWELWVVSESGQFWRVPNDLGTKKAAHLGGPFASQAVTFRVVH